MLKFLYTKELFAEIPDEISLGISITGCKIHCPYCHSKELWQNIGEELSIHKVESLLDEHKGATCLLLMGGEHDMDTLTELFMFAHKRIKTAWYAGIDILPKDRKGILQYLDYIKLGHYDVELGGLQNPNTNQRLYKLTQKENRNKKQWIYSENITHRFWE